MSKLTISSTPTSQVLSDDRLTRFDQLAVLSALYNDQQLSPYLNDALCTVSTDVKVLPYMTLSPPIQARTENRSVLPQGERQCGLFPVSPLGGDQRPSSLRSGRSVVHYAPQLNPFVTTLNCYSTLHRNYFMCSSQTSIFRSQFAIHNSPQFASSNLFIHFINSRQLSQFNL